MKFNSQICTTMSQSEALLKLGLKKETADCYLFEYEKGKYKVIAEVEKNAEEKYYSQYKDVCFPAWSLHRLIVMMPECLTYYGNLYYISIREHQVKYVMDGVSDGFFGCWGGYTLYDKVINCIECLIKEGDFNKEYLNGND